MKMIESIQYKGWKSLRIDAGEAELIVPVEVGPRVIHCGTKGGTNLFAELPEQLGGKGEAGWCIRGGHRLWHSPEAVERTYVPDNAPVKVTRSGDSVLLEQDVEPTTGMRKAIQIEVKDPRTFKVSHRITNEGAWPVEFSVWALSVMKHGGYAAIPLLPKESHEGNLLPKYHIIPWTYTDFSQPAWQWHTNFIGIDVSQSRKAQKVGISDYPGWSAYWQPAGTFVVAAEVIPGARYPDAGSAFEAFHCDWMIELETLAPLKAVQPGETAEHVEWWGVFSDLPRFDSDDVFDQTLVPLVAKWREGCRD